jgi:hypothetical protein
VIDSCVPGLLAGGQGQRGAQLHPEGPERQAGVPVQVQGQARRALLLPGRRNARVHQAGQWLRLCRDVKIAVVKKKLNRVGA